MSVPFIDFRAQMATEKQMVQSAINRVLESGTLILGEELENFEQEFANYCNVGHCVGVSTGLDALSLLLRAYGIGAGDEVLVPSQTFIATWMAVSHVGATPVAVDIDPCAFTICPERLTAAITPRTRGIIAVHLYGHAAPMEQINEIASSYGLVVIEDAAQAHGAHYFGNRIGSLSAAAAFSFYPTKNLGAYGDGGAITTNDPSIAAHVKSLRNYGSQNKYLHSEIGYNARLDELQAAVLRSKLQHLDKANRSRRNAAEYYTTSLNTISALVLPSEAQGVEHVYHLYVVQCLERDLFIEWLSSQGVQCGIHYPVTPADQESYKCPNADQSSAKSLARTCVSLPLWPEISRAQQDRVISAILQYAK